MANTLSGKILQELVALVADVVPATGVAAQVQHTVREFERART